MNSLNRTGLLALTALLLVSCSTACASSGVLSPPMETSAIAKDDKLQTVTESSDKSFKNDISDPDKVVLVDFYATWCNPCRKMRPIVESLYMRYQRKLKVLKVDVDRSPNISAKYNIVSIPALKIFKNGKVIDESVGLVTESELRARLEKAMAP